MFPTPIENWIVTNGLRNVIEFWKKFYLFFFFLIYDETMHIVKNMRNMERLID